MNQQIDGLVRKVELLEVELLEKDKKLKEVHALLKELYIYYRKGEGISRLRILYIEPQIKAFLDSYDLQYCPECGQRLPNKKVCPECGQEIT